ncbi:hypothetical protein [Vulcanisaeta distributa]|uniref:hypothetical protein n=1 Tax=Vulcanisaeta distributa TaxID=164451 RepID=UPI0006D23EA4|nr:hypothetical protein [Vulcanisaeta distributa]
MDLDPISLVNNARKDLQTMANLVSTYENTRDTNILSNIMKLSLSIYDNAVKAYLVVKGIRVRDPPEHLVQVVRDFIPNEVISNDLRDLLTKCSSSIECDGSTITAMIRELEKLVNYAHAASTHRVPHSGL